MRNHPTTAARADIGRTPQLCQDALISNIGTVGLATMGAVATAAAVGIADCTKEAQALESAMAPVVRYVDGLADASGAVSDAIADNGKTFKQNYGALKTYIQDLSTEIPRTTDQLTAMSAALGQSGIGVDKQLTTGYLRDTAVSATAMDLDDQTAGNYVAKWEASFNFDHKQVMELMDQINYLGAHNATTAAEIAQSVNSAASMGQIAGVDPAATAAMATAMQATGVTTDRVGTSISRIYTNLSKGSNATKAQKEMWEELGFTAEGIAKSMQTDGVGTLKEVFTALQDMPDERKVAALSTLFGQWAIEGGAKITNNLGAYEKALAMVSDPSLYTGSMEREFIIQASTSESIDTMMKNSVTALKQDIGTEFLPVKKTLSLAMIDLMNGVRKDMPQLQTLAGTLAGLLSAGISKLGDALQAALPYVQKALDYVADNGPQVAGILGGMAGTFAAMKFAPLAGNLLEGAESLLFGESGGLGVAAGGSERSGGLLGAVGSLFTGGQKFAGNAVGTISNVAEAAGVGATMANSNMTRTQWGAVTSNGSGSFMQRLENSAIGAYFGIKNRGTLTNQKGTDYKFMQGLMGVAGQITDAKQGGGLLGMAKNAVTSSPIGQYFGGIRAAAGNVANTTIGSKIVGFGKGTIGVSKEILAGIAGPEGLGLTNLVSGAKGLAQNGAGWVAGKAGNVISTVANSGVGQAIGGAAGRVGGVAKGVVSVGSNALGALGNFAGAGAGLLGSVWGPVAGGFGSLFAGAAPVIAAISGIIAVVSILGDHLEDIRGIVVNVFGETGGQVFDVFTGKLQGVADFVTGLFSEGGVAAALAPLQNTITNLFGENAGAAFGGVVTILQSIMGVVGQIVTFATGTVKPIIQDVFTFITGTVLPIILQTFTAAAPTIASIMGMKPREVADKLRVHVSTIYRELKRGAYDRLDGGTWEVKTAYSPDIAEEKYQAHLREKGPDLKIGNDHELANYIETTILDKDCSPAAVLGFAMIEGKKFKTSLSVPTIYKYIAKGLFLNLTQEELPRHGKKKHKYKKVKKNKSASRAPAGESIEQRPEEIDEREEFGHWEGDTVYSGKGKRKTTRALLTLTERKTRKEIIIAIPNRKAETVVKALDALERKLGARRFRAIFKSITFDNGTEFAAAEELERSCVNKRLPRTKVYFCHPYSSWERGTNENTNGMIRRRFPKGTNFAAVTNAQITQAENWINNYPRKILGYKSSEIVFRECLRELGIAA